MKNLLHLGDYYISNFISDSDLEKNDKYSLDLVLDEKNKTPRLKKIAPLNKMYGKYWYRSGINNSMILQLKNIVDSITEKFSFKKDDIWLDIACNDGTLLKYVPSEFIKLGIDPADESYYNESSKVAKVVQDFFSKEAYYKTGYGNKKCNIITLIAMFYDLENPDQVIQDIYDILDDDGLLVLQLSYTPLMLNQLAFDNICHEHLYYYSLTTLKNIFQKHNFEIIDCDLNDTNGGSFRIFLQKTCKTKNKYGTTPYRDVCKFKIEALLAIEKSKYDIANESIWYEFQSKIENLKKQTTNFIIQEKKKNKKIYGYGASTKGNTLLQYFNLNNDLITAIADKSVYKHGLKTIGTNIPIISEEQMRKEKPDYLLILPWHFVEEFKNREKEFLNAGGKFIVPCPEFTII